MVRRSGSVDGKLESKCEKILMVIILISTPLIFPPPFFKMGSGNSSGALTDENTIISILKVMAVTMYWIPLSAVVDSSASLRLLDLMLCPSKSIRLYAAEALLVLYSRAASGQQSCYRYDAVLHPFFEPYSSPFGGVMTGFDKIRHAWARCHNNQPFSQVQASEQEYFVIKRIAQVHQNVFFFFEN